MTTRPRFTLTPSDALLAQVPGVVTLRGYKNLAIAAWAGQATGPAAELVVRSMDRPEAQGLRQSYIHVIHNKLPLPDAAARNAFMTSMKQRSSDLACVAIVVQGSGFWASAMRNAVIGMRVFAPRAFEFRVFGTCEEVVDWLPAMHEKRTGIAVSPIALGRWLGALPVTQLHA